MNRPTLAQRLLREGIPPSLLIDLYDTEGMRAALAGEVLANEVAQLLRPQDTAVIRTA